jgi:hypothetical protein
MVNLLMLEPVAHNRHWVKSKEGHPALQKRGYWKVAKKSVSNAHAGKRG